MFGLFRRPRPAQAMAPTPGGYLRPATGHELLATPRRQKLIENIWQRTSLSRDQFAVLYIKPLERYAALVQQLPASENHHHSYPGGMLDHGLEIVAYALKIRAPYLLPIGAAPETQAAQSEVWSAGAAYGALIHDLGKIAVDIEVVLEGGDRWFPWHGVILRPYRFKYVRGRDYRLHCAASALLCNQVMTADIYDWLSGYQELWSSLLFVLAGQYEHAGVLGEIVTQADQASVAQELGANPQRAMAAPKNTLPQQLADGLRLLVSEKMKLNQPSGPSDGWLTQDALWLVSKPAADHLRALMLTQGVESVPTSNAPFFNMLQDNSLVQGNEEGKAIWKATIDNGQGWKSTFTLLKVAPALIWPNAADRPAAFSGSLTVENDVAVADGNEPPIQPGDSASGVQPLNPAMATPPPTPLQPLTPNAQPQIGSGSDDLMDELLNMFPDVHPEGVAADSLQEETPPLIEQISPQALIKLVQPKPAATGKSGRLTSTPSLDQVAAEPILNLIDQQIDPDRVGVDFMKWLKDGVLEHKLVINDAKARIHTVYGTVFLVSPGIFKRYVQEFPGIEPIARSRGIESWSLVQRQFEKLKLHRKTIENTNIWTCEVLGPRKSKNLKGYLLNEPSQVFNQTPFDNPSIKLLLEEVK